jgi:hypothetical protein
MATLIFVDKENGEAGSRVAPKNGLKPGCGPGEYTAAVTVWGER